MIKISVCFALLLQDDFDGAVILNGGHYFELDGLPCRPIQKPDGYYVFTGVPAFPCTLTVLSARYAPASLTMDFAPPEPGGRTVVLRLTRAYAIRFPDCERVEGIFQPHAEVLAVARESPPLRLLRLQEETDGFSIELKGYTARTLCGRRYAVGEGKNRELFLLTRKSPGGSYLLDHPPKVSHPPDSPVRRAYRTICDEKGRYAIPIEPLTRPLIDSIEFYNEEADQWVCL